MNYKRKNFSAILDNIRQFLIANNSCKNDEWWLRNMQIQWK